MKVIKEDKNKIAVLGWGRFNPPTIGHQLLGQFVKNTASKVGGTPMIYSSHTYKKKKDKNGLWGDPLPYEEKAKWLKKVFGNIFVESDLKVLTDILKDIYNKGYRELYLVAGSDRIDEYSTLINKYNNVPTKSGNILYNFDNIEIVPVGEERDDNAEGVASVSGTGTRKLAYDGDLEGFKKAVPFNDSDAEELYNVLRSELGVSDMKVEKLLNEGWADFEKNVSNYLNSLFNNVNEDLSEPIRFETAGANNSTESDVKCYYGDKLLFYVECKQTPANGGTFQLNCKTDPNGGHPQFSPAKGRASQGIYSDAVNDIVAILNNNDDIQSQFNANYKNRIQITDNKSVNGVKTIGVNDYNALQNMRSVVEASYDKSTKNAPIIAANDKGKIVVGPLDSDIITVSNLTVRPKVDYVSNISVDNVRKSIIDKIIDAGYVDSPEAIIEYNRGGSKKDIKILFASDKLNIGKNEATWEKIVLDDGTFFYITPSNINPYHDDPNFKSLCDWVNNTNETVFQVKKPSVRQAYMCDALLDINEDSSIVKNNNDDYVKKLIEACIELYI